MDTPPSPEPTFYESILTNLDHSLRHLRLSHSDFPQTSPYATTSVDTPKPILTFGESFASWTSTINTQLLTIGYPWYTSSTIPLHTQNRLREPHRRCTKQNARAGAIDVLLAGLSDEIRLRIPDSALRDPFRLWSAIEATAKPLRFTSLSGELRNRIYEFYLADAGQLEVEINRCFCTRPEPPAILKASRLLRREAGSLYFLKTTFVLDSSAWRTYGVRYGADLATKTWFSNTAARIFRNELRRVRIVGTCLFRFRYCFELWVDEGTGLLMVECPEIMSEGRKKAVQEYVDSVNGEVGLRGLKGERICEAIVRRPEMWSMRLEWIENPRFRRR